MIFDETILGAGWAGLLYAQAALKRGIRKISLVEANKKEERGGLLKSQTIDGFTFDVE